MRLLISTKQECLVHCSYHFFLVVVQDFFDMSYMLRVGTSEEAMTMMLAMVMWGCSDYTALPSLTAHPSTRYGLSIARKRDLLSPSPNITGPSSIRAS